MNLGEEDRKALQMLIMAAPREPPVIPGTGGLRKIRFAPAKWKTGKSSAARVCYAYFGGVSIVILVAVYPKTRKDDLTQEEKKQIKRLLTRLKNQLDKDG